MGGEKGLRQEVFAAGVAGVGDQGHLRGQVAVGDFSLDGAGGVVRSPIFARAFFRGVDVAAQRALIGGDFVAVRVHVIAEEFFGEVNVDLAFVLRHVLLPLHATGVRGVGEVVVFESGSLIFEDAGVAG